MPSTTAPPRTVTALDTRPGADAASHAALGMRALAGHRPGWIAHAALARHLPGGTPTPESLEASVALGVDWIELDVCVLAGGRLVTRHDARLPGGRRLATLGEMEAAVLLPDVLDLGEAVEIIGGRTGIMLDVKDDAAAAPLAAWCDRHATAGRFAVSTESIASLMTMRERAPHVATWPSLPDLGQDRPGWVGWLSQAVRRHRNPIRLYGLVVEVSRGIAELRNRPQHGVARLGGVPWRRHLPAEIAELAERLGASAFSFHHWLITPELCEAVHRAGVAAVAWTVNDGDGARRVRDCGVDLITTDDVIGMRRALAA